MDFEAYLVSKKIDGVQFSTSEPQIWNAWKTEFDQIHPISFTAQKLYLINPFRRKYPLKVEAVRVEIKREAKPEINDDKTSSEPSLIQPPPLAKPAVPRPVFKPKPKIS
ncbi:MAG: hypothetical protein ABJA70_08070 [Chryseolinea sp.]